MSPSVTSQPTALNLAIAHGVPCQRLSQVFALQREQAPEVAVKVHEVSSGELRAGLQAGWYDVGLSLTMGADLDFSCEPLWRERMVAVLPAESPLIVQADLSLDDLLQFSVLRWPAEACDALEERLSALSGGRRDAIQDVTSFDMLALQVAAGYGVGVTAESRSDRLAGWGITMRPISDGFYELVTSLVLAASRSSPVAEQFVQRMRRIAANH